MYINRENYTEGNKAMAEALLLYYHLAVAGWFSGDETVYIDPALFEGFRYLEVVVEDAYKPEINETLLREAAIIYLLCDLNDMILEHEDSFHYWDITKKIIDAYKAGKMSAIPEVTGIFKLLESNEDEFDFGTFGEILTKIHTKYVLGVFKNLAISKLP